MIIEKNIPITRKSVGRKRIYNFESMEVGDSFKVPASQRNNILSCVRNFNYVRGYKWEFATRKIEGEDNIRVWRVK